MKNAALVFIFTGSLLGQGYTVSTFAGGGLPGNGAATSTGIGAPGATAVDRSGNLYFTSGNFILRMDAVTRNLTRVAGTGIAGFSGDHGPATAAELNQPSGLAVDSAGNVYTIDNNRIREISGGIITTIAGNGTAGATGDGGPATAAEIDSWALAVDASGNVYLTDSVVTSTILFNPAGSYYASSDTIRKVSKGIITTIAGNATCCTPTAANGVPAASVPLYGVMGIAVDSAGNVYVAGTEGLDSVAYAVYQISNGSITTVASSETAQGVVFGDFNGLAVDSKGNLFVSAHDDILEISGGAVTVFAGNGTFGFSGDGGPATSAQLHEPGSLAVDSAGDLYISDYYNFRIREVSNGIITTAVGNGGYYYSGDNGPATSAQLAQPDGLAVDSAGNLYIADAAEARIRKVSNGIISTVAGNGTAGFSGDGGPATAAALNNPSGVAVDSAGNLYIADSGNNCVRKVSRGVITTVAGGGPATPNFGDGGPATSAYFQTVGDVAVDSDGNLYISDPNANRVREVSNGIVSTVTSAVVEPNYIAVDGTGNLYIVDSRNYNIVKVSNGGVATVVGNGARGFSGDGGPASAAGLSSPQGIAVDSAGNLYIADSGRIREVSGGVINTIAGTGTLGYSGEDLPAPSAAIGPEDVAVDSAGDVYFSEPGASRVRVLQPNAANCGASVSPSTDTIGSGGGNVNFEIQIGVGCGWNVQSLPSWITYSAAAGTGSSTVTLSLATNTGAARSASFTIAGVSITITQATTLSIATPSPLAAGTAGAAYSQTLAAAGGVPPFTWSVASGSLPLGLTLSSAGIVAGTPSSAGIYNFTVLVTDSAGETASLAYNLTVIPAGGTTPPGSLVTHAIGTLSPMVIDSAGNVYGTIAPNQVTPGAAQTQPGGGSCPTGIGTSGPCPTASAGKFGPDGHEIFGTLLGGQAQDSTTAMAVDAAGNVYIAGLTQGSLPTTAGAAITTSTTSSSFVAKLSADGSQFLYVTYLPASMVHPLAIAVDSAGNAYVGGWTPAFQACVLKVSPDGSSFLYNTALPGTNSAQALTVDPSGNVVVTGNTVVGSAGGKAFVEKLDPAGNVLAAMNLGGSGGELPSAIAADSAGNIYVTGVTYSADFPTTPGSFQPLRNIPIWSDATGPFGFLTRIAPDLSTLEYSTYLMDVGQPHVLAISGGGDAYLAGVSRFGFPITASAPQPCPAAGNSEYVVHFSADGSLRDSTYAGFWLRNAALALAADGSVLLAGAMEGGSNGGIFQQIRFGDAAFTPPSCLTPEALNAASQIDAGVVPGELITLAGNGIGPPNGVVYQPGPQEQIPTSTGGVQVFFDGVAAPVLYAQSQQVNTEAPFSVNGATVITLKYNGMTFGSFSEPVTFADPEILRLQIGVSTQALAFNQDNTLNGPANPAIPGSIVYFFGTGFGQTNPGCSAGSLNVPAAANLASVTVIADGGTAPVKYAGSAPTLPCGVTQINMQVPANAPSGTFAIGLQAQMGISTAMGTTSSTIVVK